MSRVGRVGGVNGGGWAGPSLTGTRVSQTIFWIRGLISAANLKFC